jgi:hypothetical protein
LAIQDAYAQAGAPEKASLFFKLHELQVHNPRIIYAFRLTQPCIFQTCSWGASKIGRVAQHIDADKGLLYSEFDTSLFSLTVIPVLGWFKLLPTFGGCVVTVSKLELEEGGRMAMEVYYYILLSRSGPLII